MGAVDVGGDKPSKQKKGLRRPKRRIAIKIDMTPMVDIAFLLLIFYMVATVFAEPQAMEINLPPSKDESQVAQSKVLTLRVDTLDNIYWNVGDDDPEIVELVNLPSLLKEKVYEIPRLITLVKINKSAHYSRMIDILDRIEVVEHQMKAAQASAKERGEIPADEEEFSYTFSLAPWTRLDTKTLERLAEKQAVGDEGAAP